MMRPARPQPPPPPSMRSARCRSFSVHPPVRPCVPSLKPRCLRAADRRYGATRSRTYSARRPPHRDPLVHNHSPTPFNVRWSIPSPHPRQLTHRAPRRSSSSVRPPVRPCVQSLKPRCLQHRRPTSWPHPQPNPTVRPRLPYRDPLVHNHSPLPFNVRRSTPSPHPRQLTHRAPRRCSNPTALRVLPYTPTPVPPWRRSAMTLSWPRRHHRYRLPPRIRASPR